MRTFKGQPITGGQKPRKSMKTPFVPDAKETSADVQTMIKEPPAPFKNKMTAAQSPAGTGPRGAVPGQEPKNIYAGKSGSSVGVKALPPGGPVGQRRPINQSGQVFGRMGISHPRKVGQQNLSKVKKRAAFYGE